MNRCFVRLRVWCLAIVASLVAVPVWAAEPDVELLQINVGLDGYYQLGSWTRLTATVKSTAGSPVSAKLVVIAPDADGQLVRTAGPTKNLTPGQTDVLQARCVPGRSSGDIILRVELQSGSVLERRLQSGDSTAGKTTIRPGLRQEVTLWGLCGLSPAVFDVATSKPTAVAVEPNPAPVTEELRPELITLTPNVIPDEAVDLASLDTLILATTAQAAGSPQTILSQLSAKQQQAIRDWVQIRGGHLVLSVGSHLEEFQKSELGQWLNLPLEGEIGIRQLDGLESYSPHPDLLRVDGTIEAIRVGNTGGNVLARSFDGPLLVQMPYGFGRVTFLAVDLQRPPLSKWQGLGNMLRKVLSIERDQIREVRTKNTQLSKSSINDLSSQLFAGLEEFPGVVRLSLWSVMGLLAVYILIVGPLDYLIVHRWLRRPQATWITLTLWVVLGSGLIVGLSNSLNGTKLRATQLEVVDLDETSRLVSGHSWLTLYSPRTTRSSVELTQVMPNWVKEGKIETTAPVVSWIAPAENRVGGLYREGGVLLTQREYHSSAPAAGSQSSPGYDDVPMQVWSTTRFGGEWSGHSPQLVESSLVSSELGRLTGTVGHHLPGTLSDCLLAYANRVYMPIRPQSQGEGKSELKAHVVWEIGGGQPVEQRELRSFLTQVRMKEVRRGTARFSTELLDVQTPYETSKRDIGYILRMLTFHQASGGRDYTGLRHDVLGNFDMSSHLRLGRAVLMGRLTVDKSEKKTSAEWKVAGQVVTDEGAQTYVRIVLPVNRDREDEAKQILEPNK